ncbi:hypothetical protein IMSAG025_00116 [Muribaculaceae bacterium]|nr:hypothetical protein IMSAG025_00116 [Muribaculaceae bacterium]
MTKELQNLAWSILPKEFKEEVKKYLATYKSAINTHDNVINYIFGEHNLTSDVEGAEMLTCEKSIAQDMAKSAIHSIQIHDFEGNTKASQNMAAFNRGIKFALDQLFGSKCLPDDANEDNFVSKEPQPTETFTDDCNSQSKTASMSTLSPKNVEYPHIASKESHYRNLSQETANCDKQFDAIIKDGFAKERRLNIAAMIEPALISNPDLWKRCGNYYAGPGKDTAHSFAELALEYADALISKADKGKKK